MSSTLTHVRNVVIILALAALVALIPGGGTGANVAIQAVSLAFLASIGWVASLMYRQHRFTLDSLGSRRRAILYAAIALATLTLTATSRLMSTGPGTAVWIVLLAAAVYAVFAVVWSARKY